LASLIHIKNPLIIEHPILFNPFGVVFMRKFITPVSPGAIHVEPPSGLRRSSLAHVILTGAGVLPQAGHL
jgi:hypothetical protein